jgi:hypothetical protein
VFVKDEWDGVDVSLVPNQENLLVRSRRIDQHTGLRISKDDEGNLTDQNPAMLEKPTLFLRVPMNIHRKISHYIYIVNSPAIDNECP